jgi:nucleotide-binding universal stress UspA family protein
MGKHPVEHIACITDLTASSLPAFHHALALALAARAKLTLLYIGPQHHDEVDWPAFPKVRETLTEWGRLPPGTDQSAVAMELGVEVRKQAFRDQSLLQGLKAFLRQHHTDLVVSCATPGGGRWLREAGVEGMVRDNLGHLLLLPSGSNGFVAGDSGNCSLTHTVLPVANHPSPSNAVRLCEQLLPVVCASRPQVTLLHVGNRSSAPELQPDAAALDWRWQFAKGRVQDQIQVCLAEQAAGLLVMPSAGRPGLWQSLRRSHTEQMLRQASCPILAVASS